jgi:dTDP-4-dehydrorhamnose 3,5-epimerase
VGLYVNAQPSPIPGVLVVESATHRDDRGVFARLFCADALKSVLEHRQIVQINRSVTQHTGAVRGLHYQRPPSSEMKFVRCLAGKVWDVVVDVRAHSRTFLTWHAEELSGVNGRMLVIPEGCAHGFQVLEAGSEMLYLHTALYAPGDEEGIRATDPRIAIPWPLTVRDLSRRDAQFPLLTADFPGLSV